MARTTNYSLFESIFSVTPKVTETKFRNFEKKVTLLIKEAISLGKYIIENSVSEGDLDYGRIELHLLNEGKFFKSDLIDVTIQHGNLFKTNCDTYSSLEYIIQEFFNKDGCNPSPRGRQPFRLTEFEKVKIGFYAQFLTLKTVADAFQVNILTVARYRDEYKFPKVLA